jgi:hypothetical protein
MTSWRSQHVVEHLCTINEWWYISVDFSLFIFVDIIVGSPDDKGFTILLFPPKIQPVSRIIKLGSLPKTEKYFKYWSEARTEFFTHHINMDNMKQLQVWQAQQGNILSNVSD